MSLESKQSTLDLLSKGDQRSDGSLVRSGKVTFLVDADDGYKMSVDEQLVFVNLSEATAFDLILPSVREAAGKLYAITPNLGTGSLAISDRGGDAGTVSIDAVSEEILVLFSTGYNWCVLFNDVTTAD
jgi:hypothetical protein